VNIEHHSRGLRVRNVQTPTGVVALLRPVAEQLLKNGVISGDLDGELHAADAMTVKAAVMQGAGVCDFCSAPGPSRGFDVPDFQMDDFSGIESTGGWAACDTCAALIDKDNRKGLLQRSIDTAAFPKFTHSALKELHSRFWRGMDQMVDVTATAKAVVDIIAGTIPEDIDRQFPTPLPKIPKDIRKAGVQRELKFTDEEMTLLEKGQVSSSMARRLLEWKAAGKSKLAPELVKGRAPLVDDGIPHWQRALDMKFLAHKELKAKLDEAVATPWKQQSHLIRLRNQGFFDDVRWLREARAYSFNAETIAAIREASLRLPTDVALSEIDFPNTGAGWFYFAEPLPISASPASSDRVHALLWGWESQAGYEVALPDDIVAKLSEVDQGQLADYHKRAAEGEPARMLYTEQTIKQLGKILRSIGVTPEQLDGWSKKVEVDPALVFSAYVIDHKGQYLKPGTISPSTRFYWRFTCTLDEMLDRNGKSWDVSYGPGSEQEGAHYVMDKEATLRCVGELARFFAMACVWFKQTVATTPPQLTQENGHVERHARKRMMHEHKLTEPPQVRVVALRKSARVAREDAPAEQQEGAREYHCRWVVTGHPRRQVCGPGRKDRKLIWIETHIAGPDDKPLRTRETVYAVIR